MSFEMNIIPWSYALVLVLMATSLALLISYSWRQYIVALAVQYLVIFWLVTLVWPLGLAAVKLVVGWMAGAVLGASQSSQALQYGNEDRRSGIIFRTLSAILVWVFVFSFSPALSTWAPIPISILLSGIVLISMGILQLGMASHPLRVTGGLLTTFSGFELLYAALESAVLVTGLLAVVTLGLALVGVYLMSEQSPEEFEGSDNNTDENDDPLMEGIS